jgi:peroxiredoxin
MALQVGQAAPEFKLFNTEKKEVSLSDYKGKNLVILFFPQAFTGTCTAELCSIRDNYNWYTSLNTEVIGISVDSLFTLAAYKKDQNYQFDLLADFNKTVSPQYDSLIEEFVFGMKGVSKRSAFVVDKEGIIRYIEICEKVTDLPNFDAIKACLEKL